MPTIPSGAATGMGTIRIYHVLPLHQEPRIPATGTPHCRFLFRPAQPAGRPGSLLGHESSRHPRHSRDASAAAIMASALYELRTYVSAEYGNRYQSIADKIVDSLNRHYQAEPGTTYGFLLLHSTGHHPGGDEIDVPINYADYYYLEALARKEALKQ